MMIESVKTTSMEKERTVVPGKNKNYLRSENKANDKQGTIISWEVEIYANTYS